MVREQEYQGLRILVDVRDTSTSESTVRLAASVVRSTGGIVTLIMIIPHEQKRAQANATLERYAAIIAPNPVEICIRTGHPTEEIAKEASSGDYDLAIIGERPDNLLLKHLFTRAAERTIQAITCPVLIASSHHGPMKRLLVCEGGRSTRLLPELAGRLAPLTRSADEVMILHVMSQITASPGIAGWELRAKAEELIDHHTPEGEQLSYDLGIIHHLEVDVSVKVRHGLVVEEILAEAEAGDFDVIVVGMPQVSGWQRFLVDDPVHKVILHSNKPVLTIA